MLVPPEDLTYATAHKTRENKRVVRVEARVVYGCAAAVQSALDNSGASNSVHTAFIGRHNGTDRHRNAQGTQDLLILEGLGGA